MVALSDDDSNIVGGDDRIVIVVVSFRMSVLVVIDVGDSDDRHPNSLQNSVRAYLNVCM